MGGRDSGGSETQFSGGEFIAVPEAWLETVGLSSFSVARYPTTVAEYGEFIEAGGYKERKWWSNRGWYWRTEHRITQPKYWGERGYDLPALPVTGVAFWEAEAYAKFRSAALPTEREWYLIASNARDSRFPWGEDAAPSPARANLAFFGLFNESRRVPVNRSSSGESEVGIRDLIGNAAEWCLPEAGRELPPAARLGVLRGGCCWHVPDVADTSFRDMVPLGVRDNQTGIRLVRRIAVDDRESDHHSIGWPGESRSLGRSIKRPTAPFRQEGIPQDLDESKWRLKIHGLGVDPPHEFSLLDLEQQFATVSEEGLFVCVCRWGQHNVFTGVRLREVLSRCNIPSRHDLYLRQVSTPGPDGETFETTCPLEVALQHEVLLAWAMDDQRLTHELGWPLRYVDFHQYGYKCVKSLGELVITDEYRRGWWETASGYDIDGTILPGTITVVGDDARRLELAKRGRVVLDGLSRRGDPKS